MSVNGIKELFKKEKLEDLVIYNDTISDTVEHAAKMIGCEPKQIAKTMSFIVNDEPILIVSSGEAKIDNLKYRTYFKCKAKMIPYDKVEELIGHLPGGVSPFAVNENVKVYLDISLKRLNIVYTGGGDEHNIVKVTVEQLYKYSNPVEYIDVCKNWNE